MTTSAPEQTLQETMTKLETALLAPVVSGEMKSWIQNVQQAAATFATDWMRDLHSVIHTQYAEIAQNDAELLPCVEKMIQTDQQLLEDLARFHEELHELQQRASQVQWQESKLDSQRQRVEEDGIGLILRIKRQQAAAATWLTEAVYRDRGVGD